MRRSLAPVVALAVALGGGHPARAATPPSDFEQRMAQADEHAGQGRHAEALEAYASAFTTMPPALQGSGVGEFVAVAAANAALADFRARGDRKALEDGRAVLLAFIDAAQGADPATGPASIDEATARLAELDAAMPAAARDEPPPPTASPRSEPEPTPPADAAPDRSRLGLGLAVSGGVMALAGVGLLVAGLRQVPWYEGKLEAEGWVPTDEGYDQQIADAERIRSLDVGLGVGALVIGMALGITGGVLLAKRTRGKGAVAVAPRIGRERAMISATMRF